MDDDDLPPIPKIPEGLRLAASEGRLVPFVGAGVSMLAGCPSWDDLADQALKSFVDANILDHGQYEQIRTLRPRIKLSIAQELEALHRKGIEADAPDPRIDRADRLNHTWKHAPAWFGHEVSRRTHLEAWKALLRRAARSAQVFDWDSSGTPTTAHLARIEGKWFVVQFFKEGPLAGQLATAFVPTQAELGAMLARLGH